MLLKERPEDASGDLQIRRLRERLSTVYQVDSFAPVKLPTADAVRDRTGKISTLLFSEILTQLWL